MHHYYIYYRIAAEQAPHVTIAVQAIQSQIETRHGIRGRLLKKRNEPNLWMEVYENVPENVAFEGALTAAVLQSGIADFLSPDETRHVECFED